jgi:Skp family chaperone for outer membrane proteins
MKWKHGLALGLGIVMSVTASAAESRVAVISVNAVIREHPDVKPNESVLEERRQEFEIERIELVEKLQGMKASFDDVRKEVENRALSEAARADNFKAAQEKYVELREYEKEVRDTQLKRQKSLNDLRMRMRGRIVDKIQAVVKEYAARKGFEIVLNADSGELMQVLYHTKNVDITEDIIKRVTAKATVDED